MSRTWKWILGIVLGLVILAGVGFLAARYFGYGHLSFWDGTAFYGHPMMDGYGFDRRGPLGNSQNFRHPMMGRWGFGIFSFPFLFLGGIMRLLFPLAVVALVAYFAYQQGKRAGMNAVQGAPTPEPNEELSE